MNKSRFFAVFAFLFAILVFNSCDEETELLDPCVLSPCNGSSFQVDFNGGTYMATATDAVFTENGITISGLKSNGENFEIVLDGTSAKTYTDDEVMIAYTPNIASEFDYINEDGELVANGTVTITGINQETQTISGTFSFTGYWSDFDSDIQREPIVFTNGSFTIPFTGINPDPNPDPEPSAGDYWPFAVGNEWAFLNNGNPQEPMQIASAQTIGGNTYYKFNNLFGESASGMGFEAEILGRKTGGDYYLRQSVNIPGDDETPSITVSPLEVLFLKDYLAVNETWTQTLTQTTTIQGLPAIQTSVLITGKILEKGITITVNGHEYTDVIKSELIQDTQGEVNTNYYWFAKDIGPIRVISTFEDQENTMELDSYIVN